MINTRKFILWLGCPKITNVYHADRVFRVELSYWTFAVLLVKSGYLGTCNCKFAGKYLISSDCPKKNLRMFHICSFNRLGDMAIFARWALRTPPRDQISQKSPCTIGLNLCILYLNNEIVVKQRKSLRSIQLISTIIYFH